MAERPLYTLYKNLKAQNYDVPDDYNKFESALTRDGKSGADNRHAIYENLKAQNFDVPDTYERFYSALFVPRSKTSSRAKGGSVPMSAADRARFSAGAAAISASAKQIVNNAGRYNRLKQRKQKQQNDFGRVNLGTHLTPFGGDANNVVKDEFAYNPETGKSGAYVTSDNENAYTQSDAGQKQAILDQQNAAYKQAVDTGEIPSVFDVRDKKGNYDLQENIGKNGTYLTEEGAQKQFDKKLADAYARKKEIEALIAEDNRQHGNPLLSYSASIGAGNGRTAEQSDYRNKLVTSLSLVTDQIGALEAVKQYPTSSWGEDALKALDNTAFTAKTWDFGLTDFAIMGQMERIKTKMDNNIPLSGSDKMLLKSKLGADAATALEDEKMGNIYRWTKIAGQSLPFMADFFLTGGYGGITKGISRGVLKIAAKRGMGKVSAAILKNTGIVAGDIIGSYAMAGTEQAMKTGADIMQRHLGNLYQDEKGDYKFGTFDENGNLLHEGGESMGTALYKGLTSAMVENYTEKLFGHNYGIKKGAVNFMEKHGMNASAEFFKNIGKSGWYTNSKKWMEKFGINGFGEEVMEEEIGIPLHALLDGDNNFSDLGDAKQQLDIIGGMAISVGSMYAMGAGSRPVKGIYNRAQYYRFRNKVNVADIDAQNLIGDNWADIKDKIDNATNEQMGGILSDILRQRNTMTKEQINAAVNYGVNLMKMRGYNIAKTAEMNAKEITNEPTTPEEQHQTDIDNAYSEGHDADDADKHDIQIQHEDQAKTLAAALNISEQQLSGMSDEELESLTGQDDKLDQAIYDYQLSSARYQGVVDDAQDKVDLAAHQAEQRVDMYTDRSRGSVRNATIKASGGAEDYGVYIISGNIATNDDGSIDASNSDDMILYYDPTTNSVEHADAFMFAELGEELPADDVKAQAVAYAKENAIKEVAGIIDGTVEVGSQFSVTDADGTEHTYEVLADNGDGTAMITIDGNVPTELVKGENVQIPYSFAGLQQMKDEEDLKRLEAAKAEREKMEKERVAQQTQETEQTQPSFDFNQILNDDGNVVLVDVLGKDGNTKYPNSQLFLIRDSGAKAKVVELTSDGSLIPHAVNKKDVRTATTMTLDEYKQAFAASSMIEDNSGENRGEIEAEPATIEDETTPDVAENTETTTPSDETAETPSTEQTPAITLEDGTIVSILDDGNPDFSKLSASQTAELYDTEFGEDADGIVSGYVSDKKKALDKANNMTVKGKTFVEQKASKDAKEKAIADAQAAYDSAIAIRDAYNERQLAKVEDTAEGRKNLIEKARRKFARLKSSVKDDAEAVAQIYKDTVGSLLHRLYDGTGIDVTDTIPLTAEEYVASNLGAHSLNYEGTETSKSVKQETGLSREDFAKTQLLAADGKGTTIDALVHSLWENRPSNLDSLDTQDIRNALIDVLTSGFKASEARSFIENIRIAQAEKLIEEERTAAENAAYYEQQKAKEEEEKKKAELEKKAEEEKKKAELEGEEINPLAERITETDEEVESDGKYGTIYNKVYLIDGDKRVTKVDEPDANGNYTGSYYMYDGKRFGDLFEVADYIDGKAEDKNLPDKLQDGSNAIEVPEDATYDKPLGEQRTKSPFLVRENGKQQTETESDDDVEKNKVDDIKVVDNIVGNKTRKTLEKIAKIMGANIQWLYSNKQFNGRFDEKTNTIYLTLDSSITEGVQFIFGHEMTHEMRTKNPAVYDELKTLVKDMMGEDIFSTETDKMQERYKKGGARYWNNRDAIEEEVVADQLGSWIRDTNYAHTLLLKMSHPLLARLHDIVNRFLMALHGTEFSDDMRLILRSIEQAYVKTANGQVTNSETGENVSFSLRQKPEPKKKGVGYKVFVLKDGKLYPPMVANPDGAATPVGVWLDADAAPIAGESKTGRPQVKQGGKGTQGGSGKLAYRPGWHLGVVPYAIQFNRKDAEGNKTLFPKNFVFAEVEYAADVDYQEEARQEGINPSGKYQHSLAGLKHLPTDGYYMYRTNPNPETDPWVITGAMKVNRILTRAEQAELVKKAGREPQQIQEGDIVTDDVVNSINQEIADAPKFSIKTYHGSQASFDHFDHSFMGSGEGAQAYGWGTYVSEVEGIAKAYAKQNAKKNAPSKLMYQGKPMTYKTPSIIYQVAFNMDKFNISAKEAISKMIDAVEKKLASVSDTPFAKMKSKQDKDELKVLKGLNPSDFKINDDYDTVAQNLTDTKSGLDLLEDELKDAKSYVDLYQSRLDEAKGELSKAKESGTGLGVDMYESDVMYYSEQVEKYKQNVKTKESDIKDVKTKIDALQKKLYSIGKPRNLYSVDIPDDTGDNYIGWDDPLNAKQIGMWKKALLSVVPESDRAYYEEWADEMLKNRKKENNPLTGKDAYYAIDSKYASKKTSMALSKAGFVGVKVIAQRNAGGNKEGKMNYVIFDENNAQITSHTKFSIRLKSAIEETETNPSDAQKESGNYKKGHIKFGGYDYTIENPKGSTRSGKDANGKEWKVTMHDTYGYIRGKFGKDGDHLDMFINDKADLDNWNGDVFVVDQVNPDGSFDEHKVMYGYDSMDDAEKAYLANYSKGWKGLGNITGASKAEFDKWLDTSNRKLKPFADYAKVKFSQAQSVSEPRYSLKDIKPVGVGSFGNIYNQFRGNAKAAIEFLKKVRGGEAVGALHHKDIGDIDLVWGKEGTGHSDGYGLSKLVKYHPEVLDNLQEILNDMRVVSSSKNRVNLESETHKAGVRLTWDGERKSWLLTAFKKETSASDKRTDTAATSLEGDTALSQTEGSAAKIDNSSETSKENGEKFSLKDEKIKSVAEKFGVNEDDVAMYANAVEKGSTAEAARARANIKRYLLQANEDKISSFKDIIKYTKPINEALKENFGDIDAMIEERRKQVEAQRNAMEAARKRAQEEEEKRQKHLDELSLIPTDELDKRYMDAIANNDESTAREMLDESARRNGYGDVDSDYQGQGAWAAPSNPQYESDEARRSDIENSPDVNLEDIALGYNLQPDDYFDNPRAYMNNTAYGLESAHVIKNALDAIKNGEKDVKVKVYRAVPTSVKEGKLRNGDWVTPSKKYAEMHGDNRLEGKYRIIEDEVPANQLWWDGNDVNEFGFDDGKEYRYKNAKNNRKLNDLITYDNKGNVIPPSKRFNSRKSDIRFSLAGERGAAAADKADERTFRMDNLSVAKDMEKNKKKAKAIKAATGWERGADGKWRYEMPDVVLRDPKEWVNKKNLTLSDIINKPNDLFKEYPELFDAYPELKDMKIIKGRAKSGGVFYNNAITLNLGDIREAIKYDLDTHYKLANNSLKKTLVHEIQHYIQEQEGFAKGGNSEMIVDKNALDAIAKLRAEKDALAKEFYAMSPDEQQRRKYEINNRYNDITKQIERLEKSSRIGYDGYQRLAGEVEARNVSARLNMTPEERRKTLAESTEDVARKDQIFLGVGDVSFSLRDMADGKESGAADMAEDLKSLNTPDEVDYVIKTAIDDMPSGWHMANKKMIHIAQALGENRKAEIAGEEPKFSLKDGTLIKAGTYFSGGGLVEEGLKGIIDPVVAVEYDEKISGVYRNNFGQHIVTADVRDVDPKELVKHIDGEVEYFHASPVCKNYSQAKSNHTEVELDKETAASTAEFINAIKPKVVTIENVKGYKDSEAMKTITDALDANGYTWDSDVYNAADYGGYTNRERLIVRAVRDGKLPEKPKKMARKSGWYEAVADIIPTLTEKKNGVAPWMDIRLKADGIDWRNIDKPLYVMGSAYADGKVPHAFADELLPTLRTKSGDVIVMPDGKVYRAMGRVLARVSGVSDDYKMPFSENLSHTIIGNGIPTQLTEHVIAPLLTGSNPKLSLKKTNNVKDSRIIPTDVDKSVSSQIEKKYDSAIKEVMNNVAERDKRLVSNYIEQDLSDFSKMRREDINQELKSNEKWRRKNLREENREGSTYGITDARHRITEATAERELEYRNVRAKYLSETYGLQGGREISLDMVDRAFEETLGSEANRGELRALYGKARKVLVQVGAEFGGVVNAKQEGDFGFAGTDRDISLFIDTMTRTSTPQSELAHTILHEMIHQATIGAINLVKKGMADGMLTPKQIEAVNTIINTYDAYKADRRLVWEEDNYRDYGGKDEYEFAAEMADAKQRRILSIPYGERILNAANELKRVGDISLWQAIKNALRSLFEVSDKSKMDKALSDIMDDFNKNIDDISMNNIEQTDFGLNGNNRFSLRYDQFEHELNQWKKDNNLPKDAQRPTIPQRNVGESAVDFLRRVDEYRKLMALWKTAPTYEQHLLSDDTALGEFNRELQRGSVLKRIAFQDSMLAIRKAQEAIMKEVGVDRLNMAEDAYTAENRSHGKGKNEFEEYNNEFLQPLRKAYHQMKKVLGDSYDNVRIYMMAKHGLERDAQMAFRKSLEADYEDVAQRSAAYKAYKGDMNRIINDSDLEFGRVDFNTWRQRDNALRTKYSPSYMDYRYDENGIVSDYSGLSALFEGSDFEEAAYKLVKDIEDKYVTETHNLWDATNAATKKILRDGYKDGMMSKDTYQYVRDMYSHYIPLRGWDGTTAEQVWDYVGGGKGAFNQTLKTAHGRTSIADDPIAYIENMAESGILLNNKNWVKQHLMLLAQNHPTSLLTLSKAWYVKSVDVNGNEEWIPATPQITSQMNSNQVKAAIDAFEQKMEKMAQTGDATQKRDGLNITYPQTHSEEREHEVRVMKDGEEYVIYVNGDPQLAQAMNNTRAHRVREIQSGKLDRAAAWLGRKMAAAYTSLSPLFIPSNYFRDLTMTLASTAIREDAKYNYLLRKNLATSWNLGFMLRDYQRGKLREKVSSGNATPKEQMFYDFMMNGGETGFVSSLDVEDLKKKFKNDLKDLNRWKANPVKVGHTIMDSIEFLNRAIEDSNRFAVYMTSIQYGRSIDEAVNDAKNVTLNFNRKGTGEHGWQMIRNLYLFINPAVQSLQTFGALGKHHPFKFTAVTASWIASGVLVPIVNVALMQIAAAFGGGDDDKKWYNDISKKYWQFTKWDRRNNLIMWVPFTHEFIKIPLAQEFRAFYGVGDMIASNMMGGKLAKESWSQYAEDLLGQVVDMLPLDPTGYDGNIAVSLMPNAVRPVFELAFNIDFTGKPLFKETEYNKYDPNFTKAYVGTPDWLVRVSRLVNSIGNDYPDVQQNSIDAFGNSRFSINNPAVVDHVLSSYLGGAYTMGSQVLGLLTKSLNDPKEIKVADIPLFSKFVSNPDDRPVTKKQGDEFWDKKEYYDRASNTISKLKKQAKIDGDYSLLERFYGSEEYKKYKLYEKDVNEYKEARKKERAEESGDEYRPHQLNAEDIYKNHATPIDEFEDMKLKQLFEKLNSFKTRYDAIVDNAPNESDFYYNTNKAAIDAIDEISIDKQEISELKKGFLDDGKDAYNAEDMKQIRELRKKILAVLEKANKVVVANQKANAKKK